MVLGFLRNKGKRCELVDLLCCFYCYSFNNSVDFANSDVDTDTDTSCAANDETQRPESLSSDGQP